MCLRNSLKMGAHTGSLCSVLLCSGAKAPSPTERELELFFFSWRGKVLNVLRARCRTPQLITKSRWAPSAWKTLSKEFCCFVKKFFSRLLVILKNIYFYNYVCLCEFMLCMCVRETEIERGRERGCWLLWVLGSPGPLQGQEAVLATELFTPQEVLDTQK